MSNCVGLYRIGNGRWYTCHVDGTDKKASLIWSLFPMSWITYNSKGVTLK